MSVHVTEHAIARYRERVADMPEHAIIAALKTPAIQAAALFGARFVRLPSGHRIVIEDRSIITILPPEHFARQIKRRGTGRFNHTRVRNR